MRTYVRARQATILHADVDSFFASVEQRDDPRLRGRPVIVGAGVVLAASYEAKAFGVRTAMGAAQARRLCPQAAVVSPRLSAYVEASKAVFAVFDDASPVVEGLSIDEAFLDVRGLEHIRGTPVEIARRLRRDVRERSGLPITVGVAQDEVPRQGGERGREAGRPAGRAAGPRAGVPPSAPGRAAVGRRAGDRREAARVRDRARSARSPGSPEPTLVGLLGRASGGHLHALAHNRDPRPVEAGRRRALDRRAARARPQAEPPAEIDAALLGLVDRVTRRMRAAETDRAHGRRSVSGSTTSRGRRGRTRSRARPRRRRRSSPRRAALLAAAAPTIERRGLTLVGVAVANLEDDIPRQLALAVERGGGAALDAALDEVRDRFGSPGADPRRAARPRSGDRDAPPAGLTTTYRSGNWRGP